MKKNLKDVDELLPHYDFTGAERGKFAERYAKGTNLVLLDPDIAEVFADEKLLNETLRALTKIAKSAANQ